MSERKSDERGTVIFVKSFRHWRSGKIIRAEDYGKQAFVIRLK